MSYSVVFRATPASTPSIPSFPTRGPPRLDPALPAERTTTTYAYFTNNWLKQIQHKTPGGTNLQKFDYTYDANVNRLTQVDSTGATTFGYDLLNRLTSAAYPAGYGSWTWTYDAVGNRLTQTSPSGTTNYGPYDNNNRLTSAGGVNYTYDNNGNLTSTTAGQSFTWDVFNRMTSAIGPGGTATYTYNGDGQKIRRIGPDGTTRYYYDGIRPIWEADGAGSMTAQLDRDIFGNLLSRKEPAGTRRYYHFDGLGSTTALSDEAGASVATLLYDAWGNQRAATGASVPNYRFTGAELDPASGFYHMGARFYDPTIGRWLNEDPVRRSQPIGLNAYAYVSNNPMAYTDSTGLCDQKCLEDLNAKRQELAKLALKTADPVAEYVRAREMAQALEGIVGREAAQALVVRYMKSISAGADPDEAFEEVLLKIPTRQQVEDNYTIGFGLLSIGFLHLAMSVGYALEGNLPASAFYNSLGTFEINQGISYLVVATQDDKRYYNWYVYRNKLNWFQRFILWNLGLGP